MRVSYINKKLSILSNTLCALILAVIPFNLIYVLYRTGSILITNIDLILKYLNIQDFTYKDASILSINAISTLFLYIAISNLSKIMKYIYIANNQFSRIRFNILYILIASINIGFSYLSIAHNIPLLNGYIILIDLIILRLLIDTSITYVIIDNNKVTDIILQKSQETYEFIVNKNQNEYIIAKYAIVNTRLSSILNLAVTIILIIMDGIMPHYHIDIFSDYYTANITIEIYKDNIMSNKITESKQIKNIEATIKESINKYIA